MAGNSPGFIFNSSERYLLSALGLGDAGGGPDVRLSLVTAGNREGGGN